MLLIRFFHATKDKKLLHVTEPMLLPALKRLDKPLIGKTPGYWGQFSEPDFEAYCKKNKLKTGEVDARRTFDVRAEGDESTEGKGKD